MKKCYVCQTEKAFSEFHKAAKRSDGLNARCKPCQIAYNKNRYNSNPELFKFKRIEKRYKLTKNQYIQLASSGCEVCGSFENLVVDHDHNCCPPPEKGKEVQTCGNCIRGILCKTCNTADGLMNSDLEKIKSLLRYLEKNNVKH